MNFKNYKYTENNRAFQTFIHSMLTFTAHYGDTQKLVEISAPAGNGSGSLHLYIDRYYQGCFLKRERWEWVPQDPEKCEFTTDDIMVLEDLVNGGFG